VEGVLYSVCLSRNELSGIGCHIYNVVRPCALFLVGDSWQTALHSPYPGWIAVKSSCHTSVGVGFNQFVI
jgi:hypothetical protein